MDNRIFNVNGRGDDMLLGVLTLAFLQAGERTLCRAWVFSVEHGLILLESISEGIRLPAPVGVNGARGFVCDWLESEQAQSVNLTGWDANADHDGSNSPGWRVYVEDWGKVANHHSAICAVKPAFLWHGK